MKVKILAGTVVIALAVTTGIAVGDNGTRPATVIVVQPGENANDVAQRADVDSSDLLIANGLSPDDALAAGRQLLLPEANDLGVTATTVAPTTTVATTPTTTPTTLPPTPTTAPPTTTAPAPATTAPPTTTAPQTSSNGYVQSFDTAASLDSMVYAIADGRNFNNKGSRTIQADHAAPGSDGNCGGPTTTRNVQTGEPPRISGVHHLDNSNVRDQSLTYWCPNGGNHMMTAYDSSGYYHFDFRPDRTFTNVDTVCWDQSITSMGGKWTEVSVVPVSTFEANGQSMAYTNPQRNGPGKPGSWGLKIEDGVYKGVFLSKNMYSSVNQNIFMGETNHSITQERAMRTQHCVKDNGNGTVTMTRGRADGSTQTSTLSGGFPGGEVIVVFSDVGYNPTKRNDWDNEFTWHWDNLIIS